MGHTILCSKDNATRSGVDNEADGVWVVPLGCLRD